MYVSPCVGALQCVSVRTQTPNPTYAYLFTADYRVGATRPLAQWDTPWNQSSDFFVWTRTGESLQNISSHFAPGVPKFEANYNCVSLYYISIYTQLGLFGLLFDEDCQIEKRFICERV